jgi:hypothetical protein
MNTAGRKAKGRNFVLEIKAWLHGIFPASVDHDVIVPATSAPGEDLVFSPEFRAQFPYSLEMKRQESAGVIHRHMEQAAKNAGAYTPVVIMRANRQEPLVVMRLKDWENYVRPKPSDHS